MEFLRKSSCPVCCSDNVTQLFRPDEGAFNRFLELSRKKYRGAMDGWTSDISLCVLCCEVCRHIWHAEFPGQAELSAMYGSSKAIDSSKRLTEPTQRMLDEMGLLRRVVGDLPGVRKPRLLDYGSGFGMWARAAVASGFEVVAFEPSLERAASFGVEFGYRGVNSLSEIQGEKFDAINCEQVLEHVDEPRSVMETFRSLSGPLTVVRITVPNASCLLRSDKTLGLFPFDGERPHLLSPYEHLHGFTPKSLGWLVRAAGLRKCHAVLRHAPKQWLRMMIPNTFFLGRFMPAKPSSESP